MLPVIIQKNIKEQFLANKGVFIIFLLCQLVSFLGFSYIHCHYKTMSNGLDVSDTSFSILKMDIPQDTDFSYSDFTKQLAQYTEHTLSDTESIALKFDFYNHSPDYEPDVSEKLLDYTNYMPFMAYAYGEQEKMDYYKNNVKYFYGNFFQDDDISGEKLTAIIADEFQPGENKRMKNLTIDDHEVTVVGQVSTLDNRDSIIPFRSAEKNNLKPSQIIFRYNNSKLKGSSVFYTYIRNKKDIEKYFPIAEPHNELIVNNIKIPKTIEMYICTGILLLSIINFSYLYIYFLKRNKKNTDIYQICGCSQDKVKQMLIIEILLFNLVGYIVCILIARYLLIPFIFSAEPLIYFNMDMKFIIINFILINILCYIVCSPFIKKYSVLENINEEH